MNASKHGLGMTKLIHRNIVQVIDKGDHQKGLNIIQLKKVLVKDFSFFSLLQFPNKSTVSLLVYRKFEESRIHCTGPPYN